jgi:hypothetical protein
MKLSLSSVLDSLISDSTVGKIAKYFENSKEDVSSKFDLGSLEPLGFGHQGIVFPHLDPNKVVKITLNSKDYDASKYISDMNHVAPVHLAKKIKLGDHEGFLIVMDRMEKLPEDIYDFFYKIMEPIKDEMNFEPFEQKMRKSKIFLRKLRAYYRENKSCMDSRQRKYFRQMLNFIQSAHDRDMHFWDRHICQFMMDKEEKLRLVDIASISKE